MSSSFPPPDFNSVAAALLRDLAAVQVSPHSAWGYKRAAAALLQLDEPVEARLLPDGSLRKIPHVGPSSTRVILEVIETGSSATVEQAVAASPKRKDVERRRSLRMAFLSRAQVVAILNDPRLPGPSMGDYRGDLQMHSVWSDGSQSLADIVAEAMRRGYPYSAVTDHSHGLPIANGLSMEDLARQQAEIDQLNARHAGSFRLLKGIEANIRADGTLDMTRDELAQVEIVVAAPHASLRSPLPQTGRMLTAVRTPGVHILGHPRGRMYGSRPGVSADWPLIFAAAAESGVAVEIDGDPSRQDLDYHLAAQAIESGCLFALDSDAHGPRDWQFVETAIAHARLAGVPTDRIVNTWPLDRLLTWAASRSAS